MTPSWKRPSPRVAALSNGPSCHPGERTEKRYAEPAIIASSSIAASATPRAIGPVVTSPASVARPDPDGTRPRPGLTPTSPVAAAGIRIEPPPSDPGATGNRPADTATAAPPLLPPAPSARFHGFRAGGATSDSV